MDGYMPVDKRAAAAVAGAAAAVAVILSLFLLRTTIKHE
jgi:hypothetical protein